MRPAVFSFLVESARLGQAYVEMKAKTDQPEPISDKDIEQAVKTWDRLAPDEWKGLVTAGLFGEPDAVEPAAGPEG